MSLFEVLMPKLGESVQVATITKIYVSEGETIEEDQNLFEVATDKVDSEIPSPVDGVVKKIYHLENETIDVGSVIMEIEISDNGTTTQTNTTSIEKENNPSDNQEVSSSSDFENSDNVEEKYFHNSENDKKFLSPLVKKIIEIENISQIELSSIVGSGEAGRISKADVMTYLKTRDEKKITEKLEKKVSVNIPAQSEELEPMSRVRKVIAAHMMNSVRTSAHVSTVIQADVSKIVKWRNANKHLFSERYDEKLTYMHLFIDVVAKSLSSFPYINSSIIDDSVQLKKDINIGIAVATQNDELIVPVIKKVTEKSLLGIVRDSNDLFSKARENKLDADDTSDGTFTITNFGSIGALFGTPIINQPQVAILATGSIEKVPCVIETELGDTIAIRYKMYLSLSYDHRLIDGMMAGKFLNSIKDQMESFTEDKPI